MSGRLPDEREREQGREGNRAKRATILKDTPVHFGEAVLSQGFGDGDYIKPSRRVAMALIGTLDAPETVRYSEQPVALVGDAVHQSGSCESSVNCLTPTDS